MKAGAGYNSSQVLEQLLVNPKKLSSNYIYFLL